MRRVTINGKPYTVEREHGGQAYVVPVWDPRDAAQGTAGRWVPASELEPERHGPKAGEP